jgi:hypothetical protein
MTEDYVNGSLVKGSSKVRQNSSGSESPRRIVKEQAQQKGPTQMKRLATISALTALGVALIGAPAVAADTETIEETIVSETLLDLGIDASDELVGDLVDDVDITELDDEVVDTVDDALDDVEDLEDVLDDVLDTNESDQDTAWSEFGETWRVAFDVIKTDFDSCRESDVTKGVNECAATFTGALHIAHAEAMVTWATAQLDLVATLPLEEQEAATAEILSSIARAQERLVKVSAREAEKAVDVQARLDKQADRAAGRGNNGRGHEDVATETDGGATDESNSGSSKPNKPGKPDNKPGKPDNKPGKPGSDD